MDATQAAEPIARPHKKPNLFRVAVATVIGTAVEAFDFLAYGTAAALVFNKIFFPQFDPVTGTLAAFGAFASGMLARPIGGILFGHFGDRIGRKSMLTLSLLLMGICTVLIGLLPTYEQIGISAAVLLVVLHIGQGLSFGGEMGGAMLMAVEHAPPKWKAFFGSLPLVGAPLGILLPVGSFALVTRLPEADFLSWGWRLPFLASAVLIVVGLFIRHGIDESPEFEAVKRDRARARQPLEDKMPLRELLRAHGRSLLLCIGCKIAEVTLIYTFLVFSVSYAVSKLGFSRADAACPALRRRRADVHHSAVRHAGRPHRRAPRLWLGRHAAGTDGHSYFSRGGQRLAGGIQPGRLRRHGIQLRHHDRAAVQSLQRPVPRGTAALFRLSIGVQFSAAIGGGLAPLISATLVQKFGSILPVGIYLAFLGVVAGTSAFLMKPTPQDLRHG